MKIIKSYKKFEDLKGTFIGIVNNSKWAEINYIETNKNRVRGNHYHKKTLELFFIIEGKIEVFVRRLNSIRFQKYKFSKGDIFIIEPFELHIFRSITKCKWINVLSAKISETKPDIYSCGKHD